MGCTVVTVITEYVFMVGNLRSLKEHFSDHVWVRATFSKI